MTEIIHSLSSFGNEVIEYIKSIYNGRIEEHFKNNSLTEEIDIYIPEKGLWIECNNCYWHRISYTKINNRYRIATNQKVTYHQDKSRIAYKLGLRLIHIWEHQWKSINDKPFILNVLKEALDILPPVQVNISDCTIQETNIKSNITLTLQYKEYTLYTIQFHKQKQNNEYTLLYTPNYQTELYTPDALTTLFDHFIQKYKPETINYLLDFNLFTDDAYIGLGFKPTGLTKPNKFFITPNTLTLLPNHYTNYKKYMEKVITNELYCCYDSGFLKLQWKN